MVSLTSAGLYPASTIRAAAARQAAVSFAFTAASSSITACLNRKPFYFDTSTERRETYGGKTAANVVFIEASEAKRSHVPEDFGPAPLLSPRRYQQPRW
jgi:hypothetical protein